jgi:hypothetical protein
MSVTVVASTRFTVGVDVQAVKRRAVSKVNKSAFPYFLCIQ